MDKNTQFENEATHYYTRYCTIDLPNQTHHGHSCTVPQHRVHRMHWVKPPIHFQLPSSLFLPSFLNQPPAMKVEAGSYQGLGVIRTTFCGFRHVAPLWLYIQSCVRIHGRCAGYFISETQLIIKQNNERAAWNLQWQRPRGAANSLSSQVSEQVLLASEYVKVHIWFFVPIFSNY